jgi:hypothetical protein
MNLPRKVGLVYFCVKMEEVIMCLVSTVNRKTGLYEAKSTVPIVWVTGR